MFASRTALRPSDVAVRAAIVGPDPGDRLHPLHAGWPALHPERARLCRRRRRDGRPAGARRPVPLGRPPRPHRLRGDRDRRLGRPGPVLHHGLHRQGHRGRADRRVAIDFARQDGNPVEGHPPRARHLRPFVARAAARPAPAPSPPDPTATPGADRHEAPDPRPRPGRPGRRARRLLRRVGGPGHPARRPARPPGSRHDRGQGHEVHGSRQVAVKAGGRSRSTSTTRTARRTTSRSRTPPAEGLQGRDRHERQVTYQVPALAAGTYTFICDVHPDMKGTIIAQ